MIKPPVIEMASVKGKIDGNELIPVKETPGFSYGSIIIAILIIYRMIKRMNIS